jgi:hypothetical protein
MAAGLVGLGLMAAGVPGVARAQTPGPVCRGGATPRTTVQQVYVPPILDPVVAALGGNGVIGAMVDRMMVTTTENYQGVEGLNRVERHSWLTGTAVAFEYPRWLLDAYGGNRDAIQFDLDQGFLRDRGPCV